METDIRPSPVEPLLCLTRPVVAWG